MLEVEKVGTQLWSLQTQMVLLLVTMFAEFTQVEPGSGAEGLTFAPELSVILI